MTTAGTTKRRWGGHRPAGFTLLEVLLATGFSIVLLGALWTLLSVYTDLFETGQVKAENAQLARSLLKQISDDLRSAIQDPIGSQASPSQGSAPLRRFGLFGSRSELRVDILQVTPWQGNATPVGETDSYLSEVGAPRVPELRTVHYSFSTPLVEQPDLPTPTGLLRRELDFETPLGPESDLDLGAAAALYAGLDMDMPEFPSDTDVQSTGTQAPRPASDSAVWVPEVVGLEFRYFDGNGWSSDWNSIQRKTLPVAVEVVVSMSDSDGSPRTGEAEAEAEPQSADVRQPADLLHRLVVDLPGSPAYRKPKPARQPSVIRPPRPPVRRIAPKRWPKTTEVPRLPDEWIRTRSQ